MEKAKIFFSNGTELTVGVNGNNFITKTKPNFPDDLTEVRVKYDDEDEIQILKNVFIQEGAPLDDNYWFILLETPVEEIKTNEIEAQVFYTAVMTDTLMEE